MEKVRNHQSANPSHTQIFLKFVQCFPLRLSLAHLARKQGHKTPEWMRLKGTYGDHPVQAPHAKQGQKNQVVQDCVQLCFEYV